MNRQDQIFEYAFGEMSAQDAQVFEATLLNDFEAQKEINALKGLRSDFGLLSDIPDMQFSKERLRNAILDEGIQPKKRPTINWLQWLLAPTAVASLVALSFIATRNGGFEDRSSITASTMGRGGNPPTASMTLRVPGFQGEVSDPVPVPFKATEAVSEPYVAAKTTSDTKIRIRRSRRSSGQPLLVSATPPRQSGGAAFDARSPSEALASFPAFKVEASGAPAAMLAADISMEDTTIIVIDKEQESGVGAVVATEVSVSQDVVIGG